MSRLNDVVRLYESLDALRDKQGGVRTLDECSGRMSWPQRGVYFFFENGELRTDSGDGPRIVRVGTHALAAGSRTTLWRRLAQHKGVIRSGGGNHRGSIFRLVVGTALTGNRPAESCSTWGRESSAERMVRERELDHEKRVSGVIRAMPFLWLSIDDEPGAGSLRGLIERSTIALLSNYGREPIDPPSKRWLGHSCDRERVRRSGLWNQNHVDERDNPAFLKILERLINVVPA